VYFNADLLSLQLRDSEIPPWVPLRLNTTYWNYLIPPLTEMYPNNLMVINIYSSAPPTSVFASGVQIAADGNLDVFVVLNNGSLAPAFSLSGSVTTTGSADIDGSLLIGELSYVYTNFSLSASEIGPFDVTMFDELLNLLFAEGIIPAINDVLAKGFPLPSVQGVTFNNANLLWGDRYLLVSTDLTYQPPGTPVSSSSVMKKPIQVI